LFPKQKISFNGAKNFVHSLVKKMDKNLDQEILKEAGFRFVARHPNYMDQSWKAIQRKHINGRHLPDVRLKEASRLKRSTEFIQFLLESESAKYAVVDIGGLVQRLDFTWNTSEDIAEDKNEAEHFLEAMPLPQAVVYLFAPRDTVLKRLACRKRKIAIHRTLSMPELEAFCRKYEERWEVVCEMLVQRSVPVLKVNTEKKVEKIAEEINSFITKLS
jgi:hypothetical protein